MCLLAPNMNDDGRMMYVEDGLGSGTLAGSEYELQLEDGRLK